MVQTRQDVHFTSIIDLVRTDIGGFTRLVTEIPSIEYYSPVLSGHYPTVGDVRVLSAIADHG
jgi:hypothetical protein